MNRVWLITGASSGFGRAITGAAVAADDTVVATARNVTALEDLVTAHPGQVEALPLDVTNTASIQRAVHDIWDRHGRIDVLVTTPGAATSARPKRPPTRNCARCSRCTYSARPR